VTSTARQLAGFAVVGAVGFITHGALLTWSAQALGFAIEVAWVVSFACAVAVTWLLNRSFVFRFRAREHPRRAAEYARYLTVQAGGALVSFLVFKATLMAFPDLVTMPIVAVGAGSGAALLFNFLGARSLVFAPAPPEA
jgi:putative flippase GtrA